MASWDAQAERIANLYEHTTGRRSGLSDDSAVSEFLRLISEGNYVDTAAAASGLPRASVYRYLKQAETEPDNDSARAFRDAYEKALAMAETEDVQNVRRAGRSPQFWAASMTYLERRFPDRWARRAESEAGPKVIVQIGATAEHVAIVANQVNLIPSYQTQTQSESLSPQSLTDGLERQSGAKVTGESE